MADKDIEQPADQAEPVTVRGKAHGVLDLGALQDQEQQDEENS